MQVLSEICSLALVWAGVMFMPGMCWLRREALQAALKRKEPATAAGAAASAPAGKMARGHFDVLGGSGSSSDSSSAEDS